ncbi:ribosomal protein 63, mitochondrial-like [Acanthaster planci]|uniref:Ribosomal protein 63, mitochondrial-like n=1 Tax=Acanthaster planci TaxID=133434 RepID=A0A8B7ZMM2_ACAPL|nr:ribosomal protein 63, mitochondrial-like [Acanthaster planci]
MWLTQVVMAIRRSSKYTPGRLFSGKHRKHRPVTNNMVKNLMRRLEIEKENETYLCMPYLTRAEENGHAKEQNYLEYKELSDRRRSASMKPHNYIEDHLSHLKHSRKW